MLNFDFERFIVVLILASAVVGWAVIELLIWFFSLFTITFSP